MSGHEPGPRWNSAPPSRSHVNWGTLLLLVGGIVVIGYIVSRQQGALPSGADGDDGGANGAVEPTGIVQVVYGLTGSATSADLTYTDGSGNIQQQAGVGVPLKTTSGLAGIRFMVDRGSFVQLSAQNTGESGDLTCTISVNGTVINTGHSSGGFTIVTCSGTVP